MGFRFNHFNFNVLDLQKSLDFYAKALGLTEARRVEREGFTLVYLTDGETRSRRVRIPPRLHGQGFRGGAQAPRGNGLHLL